MRKYIVFYMTLRYNFPAERSGIMQVEVELEIPDYVFDFYAQVARREGLPVRQVMADTLFKLAGELSLNALHESNRKNGASG